jgi:hypothetical protein
MAIPQTTKIIGRLRNAFGKPYEGAVIKVYLAAPMVVTDNIVGTELLSTFSNSYGIFELDLVPSGADERNAENYYIFEIIKENTQYYRRFIPVSSIPLDFEDLPEYVLPGQRPLYIGRDSSGSSPSQVTVDVTGIFKWTTFDGDGTTKSFTAPGEIFIVSLNGLLLLENIDYQKTKFDTVTLDEPPKTGDILGIQYKI